MKKVIAIVSFLMSSAVIMAQSNYHQAPQRVRESFSKEYPSAEKTTWSMSNGQWNASFKDHEHGKMVARFGRDGSHIDSRIPTTERDVPGPVKDMVKQRYPQGRGHEYTRIERNHGSEHFYRVKLRNHGKDQTVYMDENGHRRNY